MKEILLTPHFYLLTSNQKNMFDLDKWQEILATMSKNKLRTGLTAFGVFWGIFMLIMLLGFGSGMENGVKADFAGEAINSLWIWQGKTSIASNGLQPGRVINFTNEDLEALQRQLVDLEYVAPRNRLTGEYAIVNKQKTGSFQVFGSVREFFMMNGERLYSGRFLNELDNKEQRKVCVIGERVKKVMFGEEQESVLGEYLNIKGMYFKVVGTFKTESNGGRNEERIYIPLTSLQAIYNQRNIIHNFGAVANETTSSLELEQKVRNILAAKHKFDPADKQALGIWNNGEQFKKFTGLFAAIKIFVSVVGLFTLFAGVVGVSNIMLIIVKERTKEIGVRKALGATPWSIVSQILQESIVITSLAGYLGLLCGVGLLALMEYAIEASGANMPFFTRPEVNVWFAFGAVAILVFAGAMAGLMPALRAAQIKPIEALRAD